MTDHGHFSIGNPTFWKHTKPKPRACIFKSYSDATKKFVEEQGKLHLLRHLPGLLQLVKLLKSELNFQLDEFDLSQKASACVPSVYLERWFTVWSEVDAVWNRSKLIFPAVDMKPISEITVGDVIPTDCGSGGITLNLIRFLSILQNSILPEHVPESPIDNIRVISFDKLRSATFLCDDPKHQENYILHQLLHPLGRIPSERHSVLSSLRFNCIYRADDLEKFALFKKSIYHEDIDQAGLEFVSNLIVDDLLCLHKALTGLIVGSNSSEISVEAFEGKLTVPTINILKNRSSWLELYSIVNTRCLALACKDPKQWSDYKGSFPQMLSQLFSEGPYCVPVPETNIDINKLNGKEILPLLAEFISLQVMHCSPRDYLVGWGLREALEFYLERVGRAGDDIEYLGEDLIVDHVGAVFQSLL